MTAQPASGGRSHIDDPLEILRVLPRQYRTQFRDEYATAVDEAHDPEGYRSLIALVRLWQLRSVAYSDPGYSARIEGARAGEVSDDVPAEQILAAWPPE